MDCLVSCVALIHSLIPSNLRSRSASSSSPYEITSRISPPRRRGRVNHLQQPVDDFRRRRLQLGERFRLCERQSPSRAETAATAAAAAATDSRRCAASAAESTSSSAAFLDREFLHSKTAAKRCRCASGRKLFDNIFAPSSGRRGRKLFGRKFPETVFKRERKRERCSRSRPSFRRRRRIAIIASPSESSVFFAFSLCGAVGSGQSRHRRTSSSSRLFG